MQRLTLHAGSIIGRDTLERAVVFTDEQSGADMTGPDHAHPGSDGAGPTAAIRGTAVPSGAAPEPSRAKQGNALRAGVLGSTDGLVSNLSLVLGVAGSGAARGVIVVAGLAGLVAGSLSMALGEYLSVQSARELFANELKIEAGQLAASPDAEVAELRDIYEQKGVPSKMAAELADYMVRNDSQLALDTMAREELGFDPNELGGSAWIAAGTSLMLFALGASVPLLPFLVTSGQVALIVAAGLSGAALFGLGAAITRLTGVNPLRSGLRQLAFGAAAASITYGIGVLVGAAVR
jgi:VIT1/CCC1 family predicted Fe2+/Mn2+ transporter